MIIGPCSETNGDSVDTKHKETRSLFLKADVHKSLLGLIWSNAKNTIRIVACASKLVPRHLWQGPKTNASRNRADCGNVIVASQCPRTLPLDCLFTELPGLLQLARAGRLVGAIWICLKDRCQHVTRKSKAVSASKNRRRSKQQITKRSNTCLWNVLDSLEGYTNQTSVLQVADPRRARALFLCRTRLQRVPPPTLTTTALLRKKSRRSLRSAQRRQQRSFAQTVWPLAAFLLLLVDVE